MRVVKVAACHVSPVFLDTQATVEKGIALIREAAASGAQLVVFPETWIPGFPIWTCLSSPVADPDLFKKLAQQAIYIDGPEIALLKRTCAEVGIIASIGFNEKAKSSVGAIWNTSILISADGEILNHHRKMVPTFYEKLVWAPGDGAGLRVSETPIGRIGTLICGENGCGVVKVMAKLKTAQAQEIHISHWPPIFPTRSPGKSGNFNLTDTIKIRASAQAFEAKSFGIVCGSPIGDNARSLLLDKNPSFAETLDAAAPSLTLFYGPSGSPTGEVLIGETEGIAYASFDLDDCIEPKQVHDFQGGYQRFDIFNLTVDRSHREPVNWQETSK